MRHRLPWKRLLGGIDLVALTVVAYLCAGIWWQVVGTRLTAPQTLPRAGVTSPSPVAEKASPTRDTPLALSRNIFAPPTATALKSEQLQVDALAATTLNLQLLGTVAVQGGDGRTEPRAVILDKAAKKQEVYRQGDTVAQATIKKILRSKVVLTVQGRDEVLAMDANPPPAAAGAGAAAGHGNRVVLNRQELQGAMGDMNSILAQVEIKPVSGDNGAGGFSLDHIAGGSLFDKIGLRNGDVLQGANGKAVATPEDAFAIYQGLKNQSNVSLTILRNGQAETVEVVLQ